MNDPDTDGPNPIMPVTTRHGLTEIPALFVYGSLMPGQSAGHILATLKAEIAPAKIAARYCSSGWGYTEGFPAIILDEQAEMVSGRLVQSRALFEVWDQLDAYEGEEYARVQARCTLEDGTMAPCQVYVLSPELAQKL